MSALTPAEIAGLGFEHVVRDAPVAIAVVAASGTVIHANGRARELTSRLGRELPADLDGSIDIFHADGRRYERPEWPAVRSLDSGEEIVDEEFFYAAPDGGRLWIRCSCSAVRDGHGEIAGAVLTMTDVTERKLQEERLTYLAGLLDNTEDAIVALDAQWFVTVWNAGAERLYGWTAAEVLGRHTLEVARLEMSDEERTAVRLAVAERGRWRGEVVAYRKDGAPVTVELITVALRDAEGQISGYLGIHRDLEESRQRVATILESITDAFIAVDRDWRYTYVNDRALRRLEVWRGRALAREAILGRSMWDLFPEAVGTEVEQRLRAAMGAPEPVEFELYFAPTDEWVEAHAHPSPDGLSVYYRNISARRRAEEGERSRIARDLHDEALQGLAHARAVTGRHAPGRHDEVHAILEQVGRQIRAAVQGLRPEGDGERPFSDALRELVATNREIAGTCEVVLELGDDLPAGAVGSRGTEVLRIIGEALANACRHAGAGRVVVRATGSASRLSVEVIDDGHGFDAAPELHGQGLRGMHERAALIGAELEVSSDDTGTTVRLQVALE
jgi:PAS domain S-box-containing protein